jgi:hypothetical protein
MLKIIMLFLLAMASLVQASETKTILECREKFSSLTIKKFVDFYEINRSIRTNRVKGNLYVNGVVLTESTGVIIAKLLSSNSNSLTFQLDNGHYFKISFIPKNELLEVQLSSNEDSLINDLNEILKTTESPLEFYRLDACTLNL